MSMQGKERHRKVNDEITLSTTQARQGITPHVTRYMLSWGLGLVIVAFALIYFLQR